jgi:hypothetical protein
MEFRETKYATIWVEQGILYIKYKQWVTLNLEASNEVLSTVTSIVRGAKYPCYCDITGINDADKDARDFIAHEISKVVTQLSLVAGNSKSKNQQYLPNYSLTKKVQ